MESEAITLNSPEPVVSIEEYAEREGREIHDVFDATVSSQPSEEMNDVKGIAYPERVSISSPEASPRQGDLPKEIKPKEIKVLSQSKEDDKKKSVSRSSPPITPPSKGRSVSSAVEAPKWSAIDIQVPAAKEQSSSSVTTPPLLPSEKNLKQRRDSLIGLRDEIKEEGLEDRKKIFALKRSLEAVQNEIADAKRDRERIKNELMFKLKEDMEAAIRIAIENATRSGSVETGWDAHSTSPKSVQSSLAAAKEKMSATSVMLQQQMEILEQLKAKAVELDNSAATKKNAVIEAINKQKEDFKNAQAEHSNRLRDILAKVITYNLWLRTKILKSCTLLG